MHEEVKSQVKSKVNSSQQNLIIPHWAIQQGNGSQRVEKMLKLFFLKEATFCTLGPRKIQPQKWQKYYLHIKADLIKEWCKNMAKTWDV